MTLTKTERRELVKLVALGGGDRSMISLIVGKCAMSGMRAGDIWEEIQGLNNSDDYEYSKNQLTQLGFKMSIWSKLRRLKRKGHIQEMDEGVHPTKSAPEDGEELDIPIKTETPETKITVVEVSDSSDSGTEDNKTGNGSKRESKRQRDHDKDETEKAMKKVRTEDLPPPGPSPEENGEDEGASEQEKDPPNDGTKTAPPKATPAAVPGHERYVCRQCNYTVRTARPMTEHYKKVHNTAQAVCTKCTFIADNGDGLREHLAEQHRIRSKRVTCKCGASFKNRRDLYTHKETDGGGECTPKPKGKKRGLALQQPKADNKMWDAGDLASGTDVNDLVSQMKGRLKRAMPGPEEPVIRAQRIEYIHPTGDGKDCFINGEARVPLKRKGSEHALLTYTRSAGQGVKMKTLTIWGGIPDAAAKYDILAEPPRTKKRQRKSLCPGTCSSELRNPGRMVYIGCLADQAGLKHCSNGVVKREISRLPGQAPPTDPAEIATYKRYLETIYEVADISGRYLEQVMPDRFDQHTKHSKGSLCRVGTGNEKRAFSSVSQVDQAGSHIHLDGNCKFGTVSVAAVFGTRGANDDERRQRHVLPDYGVVDDDGIFTTGLDFHLQPGDLHYEDARVLRHGATSPRKDDLARLALILYLAKGLDLPDHGRASQAQAEAESEGEASGGGEEEAGFVPIPSNSVQCQQCRDIVPRGESENHLKKCRKESGTAA